MARRFWLGVAFGLTAALILAAVWLRPGSAGFRPFGPEPACVPPPAPPAGLSGNAPYRSVLTIHAHAYYAANFVKVSPDELGLPSLDFAARVLTHPDSRDRLAPSRLRRMVAKAAYYSLRDKTGRLDRTWRELLSCDLDLIKIVTEHLRVADPESAIFNSLKEKLAIFECTTDGADFEDPNKSDDGVDSRLTLTVSGPSKATLISYLDPQNWDECSPYFRNTYLTDVNQLPTPVCPVQVSDPNVVNDPSKSVGAQYKGNLFEDFVCTACDSEFKNILDLTTRVNATACASPNPCGTLPPWQACYSLWDSAGCYGAQETPMLNDEGDLSICAAATTGATSAFAVTSHKLVKFDPSIVTDAFYAYVLISQQEITEMLAETVCCHPGP